MGFSRFVRTFMFVPAQVVSKGRQLKLRLFARNPWQPIFFRALDAV